MENGDSLWRRLRGTSREEKKKIIIVLASSPGDEN